MGSLVFLNDKVRALPNALLQAHTVSSNFIGAGEIIYGRRVKKHSDHCGYLWKFVSWGRNVEL
jgi:hypothetical protein